MANRKDPAHCATMNLKKKVGFVSGAVTCRSEFGADEALGLELLLENWLYKFDAARDASENSVASGEWVGMPTPVFTKEGGRLPPADYEARTKGALVDVHFSVSRNAWKVTLHLLAITTRC
jgi:hypothetical protein